MSKRGVRHRRWAWLLLGAAAAASAAAEAPHDAVLPVLRFSADALGGSFYEELRQAPQFQKLDREALGSPLELRIYHTWRIAKGSAVATGLLSAVTLGILPQVSSGEHEIVYEVLVNGVLVSSFKYQKNLTHAHSMWTGVDTTHGLGKEGTDWAKSTVELFLRDAAGDPKLSALSAEFAYYFAPAAPPAAPAH